MVMLKDQGPKKEVGEMKKDQEKMAGHPNPGGVEQYPGISTVRGAMRDLIYALVNEDILTVGWLDTADRIEKMDASDLAETLSQMIYDLYDENILTFMWSVRAFQLARDKDWTLVLRALLGLMYDLHLDSHLEYDWLVYMEMLETALWGAKNSKGGEK